MVDQQILKTYATQTYEMIFEKYPWAQIPPTTHKLLKHGVEIQEQFSLPLSYYAEDSGESAHKYYRNNSREHARQIGRHERLLDVFQYSVYYSAPKISLVYVEKRKKETEELPQEFKQIFNIQPENEP